MNKFPYKLLLTKTSDAKEPLDIVTEVRFRRRDIPSLALLFSELGSMAQTEEVVDEEVVFDFMNAMSCIAAHLRSLSEEETNDGF